MTTCVNGDEFEGKTSFVATKMIDEGWCGGGLGSDGNFVVLTKFGDGGFRVEGYGG